MQRHVDTPFLLAVLTLPLLVSWPPVIVLANVTAMLESVGSAENRGERGDLERFCEFDNRSCELDNRS